MAENSKMMSLLVQPQIPTKKKRERTTQQTRLLNVKRRRSARISSSKDPKTYADSDLRSEEDDYNPPAHGDVGPELNAPSVVDSSPTEEPTDSTEDDNEQRWQKGMTVFVGDPNLRKSYKGRVVETTKHSRKGDREYKLDFGTDTTTDEWDYNSRYIFATKHEADAYLAQLAPIS